MYHFLDGEIVKKAGIGVKLKLIVNILNVLSQWE